MRVEDATLGLLWSLWSELGVPGHGRRHGSFAIDPEPLIAWTPTLAGSDPRLLGLAFDWCAAHHDEIAKTRFPGLARHMPLESARAFAAFNGALAHHGIDWKPRAPPADLDRGREKMALPMERPALVRFRVRALCGASARAEVVTALVASGSRAAQASELTAAGVTRRSVERVLEELVAAHLVVTTEGPRRRAFRLREPGAIEQFFGAAGLRWVRWDLALSLAGTLLELSRHAGESEGLRRVEAARRWAIPSHLALGLGLEPPKGSPDRPDAFDALLDWGTRAVASI